ncbi:MAG: hypothetical protein QOE71_1683 [Pseudonocardiales bacterium]|nr:hypothetical protein [Pseudonocardiales bacterium]
MSHKSRSRFRRLSVVAATAILAAGMGVAQVHSAQAATNGTTVLASLTKPAGGVWLPGPAGTPGHFWTPDAVLGFCRVDPTANGFQTSRCVGNAKTAGQAAYDPLNQKVYVSDQSTTSVQVLRYDYNPAQEGISNPLAIQVPNNTSVGGGKGGGRAASVAISPDGTSLFVGYIKSGDVMRVANPAALRAGVAPVINQVGSTSDGRGSSGGFAMANRTDGAGVRHADLYLGEIGGVGLSMIADITGTAGRPACGAPAQCNAVTVTNSAGQTASFFPTGVATDGTTLYIGDSPRNLPAQVLAFTLSNKAETLYSTTVPTYIAGFDNQSRNQYASITGLGLAPNGDVYVGDDPTAALTIVANAQAHLWRVPFTAAAPTVTAIAPSTGPTTGATVVTVTGTDLNTGGIPTIKFGPASGSGVACANATTCTVTSPAVAGGGAVHVTVTNGGGQTGAETAADVFTYTTPPPPTAVSITSISTSAGISAGGTTVTITGANLTDPAGTPTTVSFGPNAATSVTCADSGTCTVVSPAGTGTVDVQVTAAGSTSPAVPADRFSYVQPVANLQGHGITAPKGGVTFMPGSLGGHWWSSDHSQGFCRLDPIPGARLVAINSAVCDPGFTIGSPGQATYDPRANADGTHYVYVPDNAVRSPGVWRLTFDPTTETVSTPTAMAPGLMDNLKTNSTALSPEGTALYVGDLVDGGIRRINGIGGDPRSQTVDVIATTQAQKVGGPSKGINGTMAMVGNRLFLPENNAATYVDVSQPCAAVGTITPCPTVALNFLVTPAPVFVAGIGSDPARNLVYISSSPGGANATIFRFDATTITAANPAGSPGVVYVTQGNVPATGSPEATVWCSTTCTRPAETTMIPGGKTGFSFAQGLTVDPRDSSLLITEDATAGARGGRGHVWRVPFTP